MKRGPTGRASIESPPGRLAEGQAHRAGRSGTVFSNTEMSLNRGRRER